MRVLCLGAGGIIGQHMMVSMPDWVEGIFTRREAYKDYIAFDLNDHKSIVPTIKELNPHVVINLAGENRVDVVEEFPDKFIDLNVIAPSYIGEACQAIGAYFIQVSTQGVFSGENPPYKATDIPDPITEYGKQKAKAEEYASNYGATIARVTFILGVRPFQEIGRQNPLEQMFSQRYQLQVNDRFFSPAWAPDVAKQLWKLAHKRQRGIVHIGEPIKTSRYDIARRVYHDLHLPLEQRPHIEAVSHEYFPGIAPRPINTEWAYGSLYETKTTDHLISAYGQWKRLNGPSNPS